MGWKKLVWCALRWVQFLTNSSGIRRWFNKNSRHSSGELFEMGVNEKSWIASEQSVIWLVPSLIKDELTNNDIVQINCNFRSQRKGQIR